MTNPTVQKSVTKKTVMTLVLDKDQLEQVLKQWARNHFGMTQPEIEIDFGYEDLRKVFITQTDIEEDETDD